VPLCQLPLYDTKQIFRQRDEGVACYLTPWHLASRDGTCHDGRSPWRVKGVSSGSSHRVPPRASRSVNLGSRRVSPARYGRVPRARVVSQGGVPRLVPVGGGQIQFSQAPPAWLLSLTDRSGPCHPGRPRTRTSDAPHNKPLCFSSIPDIYFARDKMRLLRTSGKW
jgi:hypothetical protein